MKARQTVTPARREHDPSRHPTLRIPLDSSPRQLARRRELASAFGAHLQADGATVQRMVAIAAADMSAVDDALVLNNLDYARGHFGDPVGDFENNRKFGQTQAGDTVCIVAHGQPGEIGGYKAEAVAETMTKKPGPIDKDLSSVVLYSCNAGMDERSGKPDSSLVHGLSAALKKRGLEIGVEGQKGIGFGFKGIGERTTVGTESQGDKAWFGVRDAMFKRPAYSAWGTPGVGFVPASELLEVAGNFTPEQIAKMSQLDKAATISTIMAPFWREVETAMGPALYDHLKGWVRVMSYVDGSQLVQDSR